MEWDKVTDIILVTAFAVLGVLAMFGLYQWISRKSLKAVDKSLTAFFPTLAVMTIIYLIFDKFLILSTRPDGSGKPSFPSSHTMVVGTIFFCTMLALPHYVKNKPLLIILDLIMLALIALTATGRILANKHWPMDVACGLVFAAILAGLYYLISKKKEQK